jgi:glutathionyl-hydroquinone reductase
VHCPPCRVDKGAFVRTAAGFRNQIAPGTQFEPEAGESGAPAVRLDTRLRSWKHSTVNTSAADLQLALRAAALKHEGESPTTSHEYCRLLPEIYKLLPAGRYHLYISYACPWACRALAALHMKVRARTIQHSVRHSDTGQCHLLSADKAIVLSCCTSSSLPGNKHGTSNSQSLQQLTTILAPCVHCSRFCLCRVCRMSLVCQ